MIVEWSWHSKNSWTYKNDYLFSFLLITHSLVLYFWTNTGLGRERRKWRNERSKESIRQGISQCLLVPKYLTIPSGFCHENPFRNEWLISPGSEGLSAVSSLCELCQLRSVTLSKHLISSKQESTEVQLRSCLGQLWGPIPASGFSAGFPEAFLQDCTADQFVLLPFIQVCFLPFPSMVPKFSFSESASLFQNLWTNHFWTLWAYS